MRRDELQVRVAWLTAGMRLERDSRPHTCKNVWARQMRLSVLKTIAWMRVSTGRLLESAYGLDCREIDR